MGINSAFKGLNTCPSEFCVTLWSFSVHRNFGPPNLSTRVKVVSSGCDVKVRTSHHFLLSKDVTNYLLLQIRRKDLQILLHTSHNLIACSFNFFTKSQNKARLSRPLVLALKSIVSFELQWAKSLSNEHSKVAVAWLGTQAYLLLCLSRNSFLGVSWWHLSAIFACTCQSFFQGNKTVLTVWSFKNYWRTLFKFQWKH